MARKARKTPKPVRIPTVRPEAAYTATAAHRAAVRDRAALDYLAAVARCGANATAYGKWRLRDQAGARPDVVVYCCRRPGRNGWFPRYEDLMPDHNEKLFPPFVAHGRTGPKWDHDPLGFTFRWEVSFGSIDVPTVKTAAELQTAARKRRANALAAQAAADQAERRSSLFDNTPDRDHQ